VTLSPPDRPVAGYRAASDLGHRAAVDAGHRSAVDAGHADPALAGRRPAIADAVSDPAADPNHNPHPTAAVTGDRAIADAECRLLVALRHDPLDGKALSQLATLRQHQGHLAEAVALARRAARLEADSAPAHALLGGLLLAGRKPQQALAPLEQALVLDPALIGARSDLAVALCSLNRYADALPHYRAAWRAQPSNNSARYLEALALLALGDYANGWRKHEVRWYAELGQSSRARLAGPSWLGEPGLEGRTILLAAEQGLGDTIQFLRYAPMVAALGARVRLLVPAPLAPLLAGMDGIERVVAYGEALPDFDTHCSLMSLPRAFRTEVATIPARVPYLPVQPDRIAAWADRLGPRRRMRIALAWSGSAAVWNRSLGLRRLAPLLDRDDCEFHAGQTEIAESDRQVMAGRSNLIDHGPALRDFADTAAMLAHMDLVITVDTALAHLAGALGRPVWTMLPLGADYRWMARGDSSPWYPTMRLFRQPAFDDWGSVVAAVNDALDRRGADRPTSDPPVADRQAP